MVGRAAPQPQEGLSVLKLLHLLMSGRWCLAVNSRIDSVLSYKDIDLLHSLPKMPRASAPGLGSSSQSPRCTPRLVSCGHRAAGPALGTSWPPSALQEVWSRDLPFVRKGAFLESSPSLPSASLWLELQGRRELLTARGGGDR